MIRNGTNEDVKQVNIIRKEVNDLHVKGEPEHFKGWTESIENYVYEFIDSQTKQLLVLEEDNVIKAFAMIEFVEKPESNYRKAMKYLEINEFGTKEVFQGKGYGKALMQEIKNIAKEKGFSKLDLNVWNFNESAVKFYERFGFEEYRTYMRFDV